MKVYTCSSTSQRERHTYRQSNRQRDRQTAKQRDRQRQRDILTGERERERDDASQKVVPLIPYPLHCSKHATWTSFLSFTKIVNHSLLSGSVPQCFKQALVTPLLKKPSFDQNMLKNYRHVQSFVSVKASGKSCAYS